MLIDATAIQEALPWVEQLDNALRVSDLAAARQVVAGARAAAHDAPTHALAVFLAARCSYSSGNFAEGLGAALEAAAGFELLGDGAGEASARALAARCLLSAGDTTAALDQALAAHQAVRAALPGQASRPLLTALTATGVVYLRLGQLETALDFCQQALDCAIKLGDHIAQGAATDTVACVHGARAARARDQGRAEEAEALEREAMRCSAEAVRIAREQGHLEYEATALNNLAESMSLVGEAEAGLALLEEWSRRVLGLRELPRVQRHHLDTRGTICLALGQPQQARELFELALTHADSSETELLVVEHLSLACEACGDDRAALAHHRRFHALHVQVTAEAAQRSAQVAAVRLQTERARERVEALVRDYAQLQQHAETLLRQSTEDPLTGLANRRRLDELLEADHQGYAVAMIDVDHFKFVNDRYSHAVGDQVLCRLASLVREGCRSVDTPVRLGGEEFVVLLPHAEAAAAASAAERLRLRIEAFDWATLAPGLAVTASIGVALGREAGSAAALLALADRRLYAAKRAGRNRVVNG